MVTIRNNPHVHVFFTTATPSGECGPDKTSSAQRSKVHGITGESTRIPVGKFTRSYSCTLITQLTHTCTMYVHMNRFYKYGYIHVHVYPYKSQALCCETETAGWYHMI